MVFITADNYADAGVHTIAVKNKELFSVKMIDVQNGLGLKSISDLLRKEMYGIFETKNITKEQKKKYIKTKKEINNELKNDYYNDKYVKSDLMEKIIKNCRGVKMCSDGVNKMEKENQRDNFRSLLGFKENDIFERKEHLITLKIKKVFPNEIIHEQYKVNKYFIDLFFPVRKLGIEIDENGHMDKCEIKERERQEIIKKETGFKIIRINPVKENFDIFDEIGKLQSFIFKSNKRLIEQSTKSL